eukprot:scaffold47039_cov62-Cyclotella_meneghiniana.AAC.5
MKHNHPSPGSKYHVLPRIFCHHPSHHLERSKIFWFRSISKKQNCSYATNLPPSPKKFNYNSEWHHIIEIRNHPSQEPYFLVNGPFLVNLDQMPRIFRNHPSPESKLLQRQSSQSSIILRNHPSAFAITHH